MISTAPDGTQYTIPNNSDGLSELREKLSPDRQTVVIQGLGFVGAAMVAAVSQARNAQGQPLYNVVGVDLGNEANFWKIGKILDGESPIDSSDESLKAAFKEGSQLNIFATHDKNVYGLADIVVMDVHLDITKKALGQTSDTTFNYNTLLSAADDICDHITDNTLIVLETTVPPGTTEKILKPHVDKRLAERDVNPNNIFVAHSYERVMPGANYLNSITNFYRVFSGIDETSTKKCREFLESFINIKDYPLTELNSPTASEMAKVLENSFRAMNIAFIQEWTEFAHMAKVNLHEVIQAIRVRPTHKNIMAPGLGVGGYCLTKDPLLADWSLQNLFDSDKSLEMSKKAVEINDLMPEFTLNLIKQFSSGISGKNVTLMGVSYLNDVADTRFSPSIYLKELLEKEGANVQLHDPLVTSLEDGTAVMNSPSHLKEIKHDVVVLTVNHSAYASLSDQELLEVFKNTELVVDCFNIIAKDKIKYLQSNQVKVVGVGKGELS